MATFSPEIRLLLARVAEARPGAVVLERLRRPADAHDAAAGNDGGEGEDDEIEVEVVVETLSAAELAERRLVT